MRPTDLALNKALGMREAPPGAEHILEMPFTPFLGNHLGTVHAAAQFALAEAASAERLLRDYGAQTGRILAVVRSVTVKYRRPATGDLLAFAQPDEATRQHLLSDLATRSRATATVLVELKDRAGTLTLAGSFSWFLGQPGSPLA